MSNPSQIMPPPMWPEKPKLKAERDVEADSCKWAKRNAWLTYKFSSPSNKAVPDRIFIRAGVVVFVEFKRKGKQPTALQFKRGQAITDKGANWHWFDNLDDFKKTMRGWYM